MGNKYKALRFNSFAMSLNICSFKGFTSDLEAIVNLIKPFIDVWYVKINSQTYASYNYYASQNKILVFEFYSRPSWI